jgi:hypothetical protein
MRPAVGRRAFDTKEKGLMRTRTIGQTGAVLAVWMALTAGAARAQSVDPATENPPQVPDDGLVIVYRAQQGLDAAPGYAPPDPNLPLPLYTTHPEQGGFFINGGFVMFRQTNPIGNQTIAVRGFIPVDNSTGEPAGHLVGSGQTALNANQVSGPNEYAPGIKMDLGWKFEDGTALTLNWMYLQDKKLTASASVVPLNFNVGAGFENSFLTAFVENVPVEFSGPANKVATVGGAAANASAAFGIWNAASMMTIEFDQRTQEYAATYRCPVYDTECYRLSALVGPSFFWIWERFKWRTVDIDGNNDIPSPTDVGIYSNIVSNRMYGVFGGCEQEWYLGCGFACVLDLTAAAYMDIVKERVRYELGLKFAGGVAKKSETVWQFVPEGRANFGLTYYPREGIQLQIGYDFMAFVNTIAMNSPVVFDMSGLNPKYNSEARIFDGFMASIALSF